MPSPTDSPRASILMVTYNHVEYITQAIESVLSQEVDFPIELVIGDDCSSDGTRDVVCSYAQRFPEIIRVLPREQNLGGRKNWMDVRSNCRGRYVALLDGDDYWSCNQKLQRQVDLLEGRPALSQCFHPVAVQFDSGDAENYILYPPGRQAIYTLADLGEKNFIMTCSAVFRNGLMKEFPVPFKTAPMGDWLLHAYHAQFGDIGYMDDVMGVYRVHRGGVFYERRNDWMLRHRNDIGCGEAILQMIDPKYHHAFLPHIANRYFAMGTLQMERGDLDGACQSAAKSWELRKCATKYNSVKAGKLWLRARYPSIEKPIQAAELLVSRLRRLKGTGGK